MNFQVNIDNDANQYEFNESRETETLTEPSHILSQPVDHKAEAFVEVHVDVKHEVVC